MLAQLTRGRIYISSGEPSGSLYAKFLVRELKKINPNLSIYGFGDETIEQAGVILVPEIPQIKSFGLDSTIIGFRKNFHLYQHIARTIHHLRPDVFIAIAYPGVNLLLCRYAKSLGIKVYYFLPPQIWAWGRFRKYFIKKWIDEVISIFPFEYQFYKNAGIRVRYLKNPLSYHLKCYRRKDFQLRIGLMPGSRPDQIRRNLSVLTELVKMIHKLNKEIDFYLILYDNHKRLDIPNIDQLKVVIENRYQAMKDCDLLIISSGTASLEARFMSIPQIFFHRPSLLDYYIFRRLLRITEYNLANLYFNNKDVQVFISLSRNYLLENICYQIRQKLLI